MFHKLGEGGSPGALSIQQKFWFEISEIPRGEWNGTFRLHRPDPSHHVLAIVLVSKIQKSGTGDNNFNFVKWNGTFQTD